MVSALLLYLAASAAHAHSTFTLAYQGRLHAAGVPANGTYEMTFKLFDTRSGPDALANALTFTNVVVTNGLFSVDLELDSELFDGSSRWLEIAVRTSGSAGAFTTLVPRQAITAAPHAIVAEKVTGPISDSQIPANIARKDGPVMFEGRLSATGFTGNGDELLNVNAFLLDGLSSGDFWRSGGNSGSVPGQHFVGTIDDKPLELRVNRTRALRLEPGTNGAPNILAGSSQNVVEPSTGGAVIAGGDANTVQEGADYSTIGGGNGNRVSRRVRGATIGGGLTNTSSARGGTVAGGEGNEVGTASNYSTISGGGDNRIVVLATVSTIAGGAENRVGNAFGATIAGGMGNEVSGVANLSTIGGGERNLIGGFSGNCTIAGGAGNMMAGQSTASTIGGGAANTIGLYNDGATVGGGAANSIEGFFATGSTISGGVANTNMGSYGTVPGGLNNFAAGHAFAAGTRARATHQGTFVWSDSNGAGVESTANDQFTALASGGVRFFADPGATTGPELAPGSGSWSSSTDRDAMTNFETIKPKELLDRVVALQIKEWSYKTQDPSVRHVAPTAQDFRAAFGLGEDERRISSIDANGVALVAIQALHSMLKDKDKEIEALKRRVAALEAGQGEQ